MKDKIVVIRYAEGFLLYARKTIGVEQAFAELKKAKDIFRENPELLDFFKSVSVTYHDKCGLMDKIFQEDFAEEIRFFLRLLIEKGRIDKFSDIVDYIRIKYSYGQEMEAVLRTSYPLDLGLIKKIQDCLEAKYRKRFKFYIDCDAQLLGGIQVIIGNTILDGSVRRRLEDLREKLMITR